MTPDHSSREREAEAIKLTLAVGGVHHTEQDASTTITKGCEMLVTTPEQLAALIADVRRQKGEEDAVICDDIHADFDSDSAAQCADAIRARLEEGE